VNFKAMFLSFVFGCGAVSLAHAQPLPSGVPVPGITPVGSTAVQLVPPGQYVTPPAPDPTAAPQASTRWREAVGAPTNYDAPESVQITPTNITNGPAQIVGSSFPYVSPEGVFSNTVTSVNTKNWSGTAIVDSSNPFSVEAIVGYFVVPTAHQAFGACTGAWDYSSQWVGIDGYNSSDVFQAGTEVNAYCSGGTTTGFYSAWIEWYPNASTRVSSPAIHPGDLVFVEIWNTSATAGYAYFKNYSTNTTAEYTLTAPSGTTLKGNSVEWIVERPNLGSASTTLTNYIDVPWLSGYAWNYAASTKTTCYEGLSCTAALPGKTFYNIQMLDDSGQGISAATIENSNFLFFQDYGSACGPLSGAPPC
jgi:hypothetical protein